MRNLIKGTLVLAALVTAAPAFAQWDGYRHDPGPGAVAGAVAGGIVGGVLGGYDYGPGYYGTEPYYEPGPGYYAPAPAAPVYEGRSVAVAPGGSDSVAYCEQRFHSYDPASGTYLGYDGMRHPCP